jgi:translation initiation factor IF-2
MELVGHLDLPFEATVLEAKKEKGLGNVVTAIIQKGTVNRGDIIVAGPAWGKIKLLFNDEGKPVKQGKPGTVIRVSSSIVRPSFAIVLISPLNCISLRSLV